MNFSKKINVKDCLVLLVAIFIYSIYILRKVNQIKSEIEFPWFICLATIKKPADCSSSNPVEIR